MLKISTAFQAMQKNKRHKDGFFATLRMTKLTAGHPLRMTKPSAGHPLGMTKKCCSTALVILNAAKRSEDSIFVFSAGMTNGTVRYFQH
jgi:hypothetical protein